MNGNDIFLILNLVQHRENKRLLDEHLAAPFAAPDLEQTDILDLCKPSLRLLSDVESWDAPLDCILTDAPGLRRYEHHIVAKKAEERPLFLPVLLVLQDQESGLATGGLWRTVDEILYAPVRRLELSARMAVLIRSRRLSRELNQKNQELKTFLYLLAHDLRAPMRAVTGFSELLEEDYSEGMPSTTLDLLQRIRRSSEEMAALMDEVLRLVRLESLSPVMGPVPIADVMEDVRLRLDAELAQRRATIHAPPDWPTVLGSKPLLVSIFHNILSNALKYTAPGVSPEITLRWEALPWGFRLHVIDNGIGIPEDKIPLIFRPFTRLHGSEEYPGMGLGLTAVKRIVDLLHGRIHVRSQVGQGTVFTVDFMRCDHVENSPR